MKTSRLLLTVSILAALLFSFAVPTAMAKGKGGGDNSPPPPVDTRILVETVDATQGTVEIKYMRDKTTRIYKVDTGTTIMVNGSPGTLADIKTGMQVRDLAERDEQSLDSIAVSEADAPPAGADSKQKKGKKSSSGDDSNQ